MTDTIIESLDENRKALVRLMTAIEELPPAKEGPCWITKAFAKEEVEKSEAALSFRDK